jgi:hypothetical protein
VRDFLRASDNANLIKCSNLGREAAVNTEYSTVNDSSQGEEVEDLTAGLPDRGISVLLLTFLVKAVYLGDLARLVVSTNECDLVRESSLVSGMTLAPLCGSKLTLPSDT